MFLSAGKKKRMEIFSELYEFNERLLINMKFSRKTLDKIACDFKYIPDIISGKKLLQGKDGEAIADYVTNLGLSDALSQIDYLNERKAYLTKFKDESLADYNKYKSLYIKIFFMLGLLAAVLLA